MVASSEKLMLAKIIVMKPIARAISQTQLAKKPPATVASTLEATMRLNVVPIAVGRPTTRLSRLRSAGRAPDASTAMCVPSLCQSRMDASSSALRRPGDCRSLRRRQSCIQNAVRQYESTSRGIARERRPGRRSGGANSRVSGRSQRFEGQTALVTGAARGLGLAAARRLANEGAQVAFLDRDEGALEAAVGRLANPRADALSHVVDVTDEGQVRAAVASVLSAAGRIDVLVNNAGVYPHFPFEELTFADWRRVLATNLDSVYLCSHAVYPGMRERGYGRIVNVSSATFFIGYPGLSAYVASKGGI